MRAVLNEDEDVANRDVEAIGVALDAHARAGELEHSFKLAAQLQDAHAFRAQSGVGGSDRLPKLPLFCAQAASAYPLRSRGARSLSRTPFVQGKKRTHRIYVSAGRMR